MNRYQNSNNGRNTPERNDQGRFMSDRDYNDDRGYSRSRSRYDQDDDARYGGRGHAQGGWFGDPEGHSEASRRGWEDRQSGGRGRNDYYDDRSYRSERGGGRSSQDYYDDDRSYNAQNRPRDDEGRFTSRGGGNYGRYDRDDDDRSYSSRGRGGQGHGGWFGDPEGHSEAARRGWEDRR